MEVMYSVMQELQYQGCVSEPRKGYNTRLQYMGCTSKPLKHNNAKLQCKGCKSKSQKRLQCKDCNATAECFNPQQRLQCKGCHTRAVIQGIKCLSYTCVLWLLVNWPPGKCYNARNAMQGFKSKPQQGPQCQGCLSAKHRLQHPQWPPFLPAKSSILTIVAFCKISVVKSRKDLPNLYKLYVCPHPTNKRPTPWMLT